MSSISSLTDSDASDLNDILYYTALHSPVTGVIVSLYELFQKEAIEGKYTGEIGEKYPSPSVKYFARKSYPEIYCTMAWGVGHVALAALQLNNRWEGERLCQKASENPQEAIALLKQAANLYRSSEATYLLGTHYRDGKMVPVDFGLALSYFHEAADLGDQRSFIALGNLYLLDDSTLAISTLERPLECATDPMRSLQNIGRHLSGFFQKWASSGMRY